MILLLLKSARAGGVPSRASVCGTTCLGLRLAVRALRACLPDADKDDLEKLYRVGP